MGFIHLKIASKLWIFVLAMIISVVTVAAIGLVRSAAIQAEGQQAQMTSMALIQVTTRWNGLTENNATRNYAMTLSAEPSISAAFKDEVTATTNAVSELQKQLETMPLRDVDRAQLQKIADLRKAVLTFRGQIRQLQADGNMESSLQVLNAQYLPAMSSYLASQKALIQMQEQRLDEVQALTQSRSQTNRNGILVALVVIIGLIFLSTAWFLRTIRQPLLQANDLASRIAQGDLSMEIDTSRGDEFGDLMKSLAGMNESLGRMVQQVRQSTGSIATASAEIASGNNDLAQRTEQTSSNLQSTASSMDQLTGTVQQSADSARQAGSLAAEASAVAERGGAVVKQVVFTMEEINASSRKISDIIGVIDGIAFQTNILALNAAVEAARAGEQGRGFAVVASEVRSLAQRSAEAAKEIKTLIGTSVEKVASGTKLVSDAGVTMSDIVQSVRKVADVIGEITAASSEQSSGISHVNQAIGNLDQMTQQNAALVEESAAAAESLRDQADQLARAVGVFKISGATSLSAPGRPARDITPRPANLTYKRPQPLARPKAAPALAPARAAAPVRKPVPGQPLTIAKPKAASPAKAAPAASAGANDDWETF
jgi:methyl-accepting chemotaxis protein